MPRNPPFLTRAEATGYRETSRNADVSAFLDRLCERNPLVHRESIGQSSEGADIPAIVLSDRKCFTPELARRQKKPVVLVEANIHAGEVEGKEMLLALARDLTLTKLGRGILDRVCLVFVPNFNPDGNDRIGPQNRRLNLKELEGQDGPEGGVGTRYNGLGFNLNRDNTKHDAVESRHMARYFQRWWPQLFIDCHTTDGSLHAFDLTFDTSRGNEPLFAPLRAFNRKLLEDVAASVQKKEGFRSFWYGNYVDENDPTSGWHTYPALPRFGSHHRGLLGRLDVLLETYSYLPFERRCAVIRAWLLGLFRSVARHREQVLSVTADEEARILARGQAPDPRTRVAINHGVARRQPDGALHFEYPAYAWDGDEAEILAFDRESIAARRYPGKKLRTYRAPHLRGFVPTEEVSLPAGYLVPASLATRLADHGIAFTALEVDRELEVEAYKVLAIEKTFSPDVAARVPPPGEAEIPLSQKPPPARFETVVTVRPERARVRVERGTLHVATAQRAGILAVYLLEPHGDDSLVRWGFLDDALQVGGTVPILRLLAALKPPQKAE